MSDLDATISRLRALPEAEQEAMSAQIDLLLDAGVDDLLSPEQWAEIEARLDSGEAMIPHEEVEKAFRDLWR